MNVILGMWKRNFKNQIRWIFENFWTVNKWWKLLYLEIFTCQVSEKIITHVHLLKAQEVECQIQIVVVSILTWCRPIINKKMNHHNEYRFVVSRCKSENHILLKNFSVDPKLTSVISKFIVSPVIVPSGFW